MAKYTDESLQRVKELARIETLAANDTQLHQRSDGTIWGCCPFHEEATPSFKIDPSKQLWHCFGCGKGGDVIKYVQERYNLDFRGAVERLATDIHTELEEDTGNFTSSPLRPKAAKPMATDTEPAKLPSDDIKHKTIAMMEQAWSAMADGCESDNPHDGAQYLMARGFTIDDVEEFCIGWNPQRRSIVFPFLVKTMSEAHAKREPGQHISLANLATGYYTERFIDADKSKRESNGERQQAHYKPPTEQYGPQPLFYGHNLYRAGVTFIVEGESDTLAVMGCGFNAVGLASAQGVAKLLKVCEARRPVAMLALLMDDDEAGRNAAEVAKKGLDALDIPSYIVAQKPGYKDPAELYGKDSTELIKHLATLRDRSLVALEEYKRGKLEEANVLDACVVVESIRRGASDDKPTPTGVKPLDDILGGGVRKELIVLGAVSSTGKTTLCVQIAENLARTGRHVLFVSVEQSAIELARQGIIRSLYNSTPEGCTLPTTADIADADVRDGWDEATAYAFDDACDEYAKGVAPCLHFMEPDHAVTLTEINQAADAIADTYGQQPFIFIDYLQLMGGDDPRQDARLVINDVVRGLRQTVRRREVPVFVISAFNRESYKAPLNQAAFRESGGIEYSADVLLGMQPLGWRTICKSKQDTEEVYTVWKAQNKRNVELVLLKHRGCNTPLKPAELSFNAPACTMEPCKQREVVRRI